MSKKNIKLEQLKVESFITELDGINKETVNGGSTPAWVISVATLAESIHEVGDNYSWWHCDNGGGNAGSEVVIGTPDGDACLLTGVEING